MLDRLSDANVVPAVSEKRNGWPIVTAFSSRGAYLNYLHEKLEADAFPDLDVEVVARKEGGTVAVTIPSLEDRKRDAPTPAERRAQLERTLAPFFDEVGL